MFRSKIKTPDGYTRHNEIETNGMLGSIFGRQFSSWLNFAACLGFSYAQEHYVGELVGNYEDKNDKHFWTAGIVDFFRERKADGTKISRRNMKDIFYGFDYELEKAAKYGMQQGIAKKIQEIKKAYAPELTSVEKALSTSLKTPVQLQLLPEKGELEFSMPEFDRRKVTQCLTNTLQVSATQIHGFADRNSYSRKIYNIEELTSQSFATQLFRAFAFKEYYPVIGTESEYMTFITSNRKDKLITHVRKNCPEIAKDAFGQEVLDTLNSIDKLEQNTKAEPPEIGMF